MKSGMMICAIFFVLLFAITAPAAAAEQPFAIDDAHIYDDMSRPYAQNYQPRIQGDTAHVVLPLMSDICEGEIRAELEPMNREASPIKLSNALTQTVERKTYKFSKEEVSAYRVYFKLSLYSSRLNGEYPLRVTVSGEDREGNAVSQVFQITLRVTDGKENAEVPDVGIEAFDEGDALYVGGKGALSLRIVNRSATRAAADIALTMADPSGDILPEASDTLTIGTLLPGESVPVEIPVRTLAKSSAQPHALSFELSYGYAGGQTASSIEKRTVNLQQEVRLNHTEAALPTRVTQGENVAFNLTLMNMGKGTLYNALLTFDIPHMAAGGSVLAGVIEPGASVASTANLRVESDFQGETRGTLTLSWEDGYGVLYEKKLPLSTSVLEKAAPVSAGAEAEAAGTDAGFTHREIIAWILAAVFLALLAANVVYTGRKIRRLEERHL